jgi:hypothetical protein
MRVDSSIGPITVEGMRLIASDDEAKSAFLNALADERLDYLRLHEGKIDEGDRARIDYFRYQ